MSITDTGVGMDEATRRLVFDPFFTTKEKGRGTGLGLASAYGIIKNHGGMINVASEIDQGTTFILHLPLSTKAISREAVSESELLRGSETILLVDDEAMIIDVGRAILQKLGYRVIVALNGREAIQMVARRSGDIQLVILDLVMPGMDGGKTFDRIREICPQLPVILSSGYAIDGQASEILRRGCNGFIQKPFDVVALSRKVRAVVDGGG